MRGTYSMRRRVAAGLLCALLLALVWGLQAPTRADAGGDVSDHQYVSEEVVSPDGSNAPTEPGGASAGPVGAPGTPYCEGMHGRVSCELR